MDGVRPWTGKVKAFLESVKCPCCVKGPRFCNEYKVKLSSGFRSKLLDERLW